jgi:hypothetical protein
VSLPESVTLRPNFTVSALADSGRLPGCFFCAEEAAGNATNRVTNVIETRMRFISNGETREEREGFVPGVDTQQAGGASPPPWLDFGGGKSPRLSLPPPRTTDVTRGMRKSRGTHDCAAWCCPVLPDLVARRIDCL